MTALLTDNLPLLAGAPNGIKKLRELVLELAVRGKLMPQDPNDEPASELLKRIAEEKARWVAEGKIKKQKPLAEIKEDEKPFELPEGWEWASTAKLVLLITDGTHHTPSYIAAGVPFISVKDIDGTTISFDNCKYISQEEHLAINARCNPERGDILLCRIGTLGRPTIVDTDAPFSLFVSVGLLKLPKETEISRYFHSVLSSPLMYRQYDQVKAGGSHTNKLNLGDIPRLLVPVPPLAEQHRIVDKVDELMALCDRLEAQQADAESAHAQLVQALLGSLTQASDAEDFAASWQRLAEHFHTLFTTEPSIDALKQTLLQLAVMGKLVPQDPSDEPASELLKGIAEEKARLVAAGKLKKQKPLAEITEAELPFGIPNNWAWSRIGELALNTEYGLSEKTSDLQDGVPVLKMGDIQSGQVLLGGQMKVSRATEGLPELYLEDEDLLYNRTNSAELVGKTGLFLGNSGEFTFASYLIRIRCLKSLFLPAYLNISMNTPVFRKTQINPHLKQQCGQANVNGTIMKNMLVTVPPIAEQHRIVAKVDQLMALCDQLKTRLTQARQLNEQLATALVEQAVA